MLAADATEAKRLVVTLQEALADLFPEARAVVKAFRQGPPIPAPLSLRLLGPETERLRTYGDRPRRIIHQLPEITHTAASIQGGEPTLWLEANEEEARLAGLTWRHCWPVPKRPEGRRRRFSAPAAALRQRLLAAIGGAHRQRCTG